MIRSFIKNLVPAKFKKELRDKLGVPSQEQSFKNLKALGYSPKYCLDIGAYEGNWAREFKAVFPDCAITMFEGQLAKEPVLVNMQKELMNVDYKIALLGAKEETVTFNIYETASSVLTEHHDTNAQTEKRELTTLDKLLKGSKIHPDFIKVDTQGYELEILKGGEQTLKHAEFVLLEVSFLDIYVDAPLVSDTVSFMKERGFVVYDICTLMKRPLDNALFQSDFLFIKETSKFRQNKKWS